MPQQGPKKKMTAALTKKGYVEKATKIWRGKPIIFFPRFSKFSGYIARFKENPLVNNTLLMFVDQLKYLS